MVHKLIIICRSAEERRKLARAARQAKKTVSRFGLEAMYKAAGIPLEERTCRLCPRRLNKANRSGVCRECTRTAGVKALRGASA